MTRLSEGIYRIERGRVFVTVSQIIIKYIGCESVVLLRKGTLVAGGLVVCRLAGLQACRLAGLQVCARGWDGQAGKNDGKLSGIPRRRAL